MFKLLQQVLCVQVLLILINLLCSTAQVAQLTGLDVKCDEEGMNVKIEFDAPFNGIIYSKGYYKDPNCRFVPAFSGNNSYRFLIRRKSDCSMQETRLLSSEHGMRSYEVTIVIQHDAQLVDAFDFSRQLQCNWFRHLRKTVTHSPIPVKSLSESKLAYPGDQVNVWMDVQKGDSPFAPLLSGDVPIGEKLTVSLYLQDASNRFDLQVKRCHAYDSQNFTAELTQKLLLTDRRGCSIRPSLLSSFLKLRHLQARSDLLPRLTNDRARSASVLVYGVVNAFRFPEQSQVYVSCSVEVCAGDCDNSCQPEVTDPDNPIPIVVPQKVKQKPMQQQVQMPIYVPNNKTNESNLIAFANEDIEPEVIENNIEVFANRSKDNSTTASLFNASQTKPSLESANGKTNSTAISNNSKLLTLIRQPARDKNQTKEAGIVRSQTVPSIEVTSKTLIVKDSMRSIQINSSESNLTSTSTVSPTRSRTNRNSRNRINSKSMNIFN